MRLPFHDIDHENCDVDSTDRMHFLWHSKLTKDLPPFMSLDRSQFPVALVFWGIWAIPKVATCMNLLHPRSLILLIRSRLCVTADSVSGHFVGSSKLGQHSNLHASVIFRYLRLSDPAMTVCDGRFL